MYQLNLTEEDINTIAFVGDRYCWSEAMSTLDVGVNLITEPDAWEIQEAVELDTEGGHSPLPMLDPRSKLYEKITNFISQIV
jgi:hypothetical protein